MVPSLRVRAVNDAPIHPGREMRGAEEWIVIPEGMGYPVTGQPVATAQRG